MNEIASAVSAESTTRSVMYVNTLNARTCCSRYWASSYSTAVSLRERVGDAFHLHEARALHEDRGALRRLVSRCFHQRVDRGEVLRALAECLHRPAARLARGEQRIDARLAREGTHFRVHLGTRIAQLAHVAHHEDGAAGVGG